MSLKYEPASEPLHSSEPGLLVEYNRIICVLEREYGGML